MKIKSVCCFAVALLSYCSTVCADVVLRVENTTLLQNTGVQKVNVFAFSLASNATNFLTADFTIAAAAPASFGSPAGEFGQPNFIGAGNIFAASSSFNRSANNPRLGLLSIDFATSQIMPVSPTLLATLNIDTNTFGLGNFNINVTNFATEAAVNTVQNGILTIAPVPEPCSIALVACAGLGIAGRRMWIRRKKATAQVV